MSSFQRGPHSVAFQPCCFEQTSAHCACMRRIVHCGCKDTYSCFQCAVNLLPTCFHATRTVHVQVRLPVSKPHKCFWSHSQSLQKGNTTKPGPSFVQCHRVGSLSCLAHAQPGRPHTHRPQLDGKNVTGRHSMVINASCCPSPLNGGAPSGVIPWRAESDAANPPLWQVALQAMIVEPVAATLPYFAVDGGVQACPLHDFPFPCYIDTWIGPAVTCVLSSIREQLEPLNQRVEQFKGSGSDHCSRGRTLNADGCLPSSVLTLPASCLLNPVHIHAKVKIQVFDRILSISAAQKPEHEQWQPFDVQVGRGRALPCTTAGGHGLAHSCVALYTAQDILQ
jgi:hypothetical protein